MLFFSGATWKIIQERPDSKTISALRGGSFLFGPKINHVGINGVGVFVSQVLLRIQARYKGRTSCSNNACYFWSGYKGDLHSAIIILVRRTWVPPLPASRRGKMTMMSPGVSPKVVGFQQAGVWKGAKELYLQVSKAPRSQGVYKVGPKTSDKYGKNSTDWDEMTPVTHLWGDS